MYSLKLTIGLDFPLTTTLELISENILGWISQNFVKHPYADVLYHVKERVEHLLSTFQGFRSLSFGMY